MYLKKQIPAVILLSIFLFLSANGALVQWTGSIDNNWTTAGNWNPATTPTAFDTVDFSSGSINCVVTGTVSMAKLRVTAGYTGVFTIDGATFTVSEDASLQGALGDSLMLNPGSTAYFNVSGTLYTNYAVIFNINCTGTQGLAFNSRNGGTVTNWQFMPAGLKYWDGSGIDNNWSTADNWMPDEIPTISDSVVFDGTSNKACYLTSPGTVKDLILISAFTGAFDVANDTITIAGNCDISNYSAPFTVLDNGAFKFAGNGAQSFNALSSNINPNIIVSNNSTLGINSSGNTIVRSINIEGGSSFNSLASFELIIKNNFINNGTFNHNNSIVKFDTTGGTHTIDIGNSTFFKLVFIGTGTYQFTSDLTVEDTLSISGATIDLGSGYTHAIAHFTALAATGTLNMNNSTIDLSGNADFSNLMSLQWQDNAVLHCMGTATQTIIPYSTIDHPSISISNTNNVSFSGLSNDVTIRDLNINTGGVFTAPNTWKLRLRSSFINNGTFNHNNGIVEFDSTTGNHEINSISPFNILNINGSGASYLFNSNIQASILSIQNGTLDMNSSFDHTIDTITSMAGTSTLNFNNSRVLINGNALLTNITSITPSSDTIEFNGITAQQISAPASMSVGHVLHSGPGTLSLNSNLDVESFTQRDGILDMVSFDLNVQSSGDFTITKGNINSLDARQIMVTGDANISGSSSDSIFITPATMGYLNVTGSLTANYAVIGNINANSSQGIATNSRDAGGNTNWVFPPAATVDIYYSVGTNMNNMRVGTPSISIISDTATITTAQADSIGVGDKITYNAGLTAFIKKRISNTQFILCRNDGTSAPDIATVPLDGIYRTFNSLNDAFLNASTSMYLNTTNLIAINARLHLACYADSTDTNAVTISGYTTSAQNSIHIFAPGPVDQVGTPQDHHGMWSDKGYKLSVSGTGASGRVIWLQVPYVKIHGLQIEYTGSNANAIQVLSVNADSCDISNNIIRLTENTPPNQRMGIYIGGAYYTRISNNLIYGFIGGTSNDGGIYTSTGQTDMAMPVYNNTVFNCAIGIQSFPNNAILAKNNLVYACSTNFGGGTFATGSSNNLSGPTQSNAPGTSSLQNSTISFFDQGNGNFRLNHGSVAINAGANLTNDPIYALDDDISFFPRDASFDIGAYEYHNTIPNAPTLDTMVSGEIINTNTVPYNISLQFDISDPDTSSWVKYHIQIDDSSNFASPEIDSQYTTLINSPANNISFSAMLNSGSYYWRVRALDQYNAPSSWSIANSGSIAFTIDGPDSPTDITLSNITVNENITTGSVVGIFNTTDPDAGNTFSYSFFAGPGDVDNSSFSIVGDTLKTASTFNFETKNSYSILISTQDNTTLNFQKQITINVNNVNESPTSLSLSDSTINENLPASSFIGILSTIDEDLSDAHTYLLVAGIGDTNNNDFIIVGDTLKSAIPFNYELKNNYSIRIRSTDAGSLSFERVFQININDIFEDTITQMPTLAKPASNDTIYNFFNIDFTLPEAALASTVKMTFMQTGGTSDFNSPHVITYGSTFESSGNHITTLNSKDLSNNTMVDSVSSNPNDFLEHEGVYSIKIGYQDVLGNSVSEVIASNVMFTDTIMPVSSPVITSAAYYESSKKLNIFFDKKVDFIDSTKNFFMSTDNGISDTVIIQAPWSWNYLDTSKTSIEILIPVADISLLEGLSNKNLLEISMQDSTFGDSAAWNLMFDYSMNFMVIYYFDNTPLTISSVLYIDSINQLMFTFNDTLSFIDTTKQLGVTHKEDSTLTFTLSTPWTYILHPTKDTVTIQLPSADAQYIENWNGVDSSLSLILASETFYSENMKNGDYNIDTLFPINYLEDPFTYNMFNILLTNSGDTAIEAYLYFINDSIHDTGNGILVNFGFGPTDIDTNQSPWPYKDSSFIVPNTVKQGYWHFTWAPISLNNVIGEIRTDSIQISNIPPIINLAAEYTIIEDSVFAVNNFVSDKNGDSINLILLDAPTDMIISQTTHSLSWIPDNSDVGIEDFYIKAIDSWGDTTTAAIKLNILNVNDAPLFDIVSLPDSIFEDSISNGFITAYDYDEGDSIELILESDSNWINISSTEITATGLLKFNITLTPDNNSTGLNIIKFHIKDKSGATLAYHDTVFVINTNDAPTVHMKQKLIANGALFLAFTGEDDFDSTFTFVLQLTSDYIQINDTNSTGEFQYYPLPDNNYNITCTIFDKGNLSDALIDSFTILGSSSFNISKSNSWNMISLPVNNYSASQFKNAGTILHWDETKEPSNIYKYYTRETGINSLTGGLSYFIKNSDSTISISLKPDSLLKDSFNIVLNSGEFGWNQIGSPYTYPIKVNNSDVTFWEYDPVAKDYVDAQGILMPWKGYWVQTDIAQTLNLNPNPHFQGTRSRRNVARHNGLEDWIYTISLSTEVSQDRDNYFGFTPQAKNNKDSFDRPEAPRVNNFPYLFFKQNEWGGSIHRFASDVRQKQSTEDFFDIGISGSSENTKDMKIKISGYMKNEDVYLFTRTSKGISAYEPGSDIIIPSSNKDQYITVIASRTPNLSIPLDFKTFSPYPNPCKPVANIKYTLPYSWQTDGSMIKGFNVKVLVYDIKGRIVKELLSNKQKPGNHKVIWNGKNSNGSLVASGAYFIRIDAEKFHAVKKIMLMR